MKWIYGFFAMLFGVFFLWTKYGPIAVLLAILAVISVCGIAAAILVFRDFIEMNRLLKHNNND